MQDGRGVTLARKKLPKKTEPESLTDVTGVTEPVRATRMEIIYFKKLRRALEASEGSD